MAPGHMTLLSTWNVVGVTEELNASLHIHVQSLSVPRGWVSTLLASEDPDWRGSCCRISTPGTTAPSLHTAGKRMRGFPWWLSGKNPPANARDMRDKGSVPGSRRSPREGNGNPLQDLDWRIPCTEGPCELHSIHGVTKSRTWLNRCSMQTRHMWQVAPHWISQTEYTSSFYLANLHCFYYCFIKSILF